MNEEEATIYHENLIKSGLLRSAKGSPWAQHYGNMSNMNYPWKMHLYANGYQDWYNLARVVIPYLVRENATFKTVKYMPEHTGNYPILEHNDSQFGKAFTIYPNNQKEFEKLALGLNELIQYTHLSTVPELDENNHNIAFEKTMGETGRIWYRAERDSNGEYISADEAKLINPQKPYNPFNFYDPFADLIPTRNQPKIKHKAGSFWYTIEKIANVQKMKQSADTSTNSMYFYPRDEKNMAALESLLRSAGVKYTNHFSKLLNKNVLRVFENDLAVINSGKNLENSAPESKNAVKDKGSFIDALNKIGGAQKMKSSSDKKSSSVYFYTNDSKDMNILESLLHAANMKYDAHYSNLLGKYVLRVWEVDLTVEIPDSTNTTNINKYKQGQINLNKKIQDKNIDFLINSEKLNGK